MDIFYLFCCLSGQLITDCSKVKYGYLWILSIPSFLFSLILLLVNAGSLAFNIYVVGVCPYRGCSYFCSKYYNSHDLLDAYIRSTMNNDTLIGGIQPENRTEYANWNKVVITTATLAGFTSYYMMIILVLIPVYTRICCCLRQNQVTICMKNFCRAWLKAFRHEKGILLPFCDSNQKQSTALNGYQKCFFLFFYCFNLALFFSSLGVFIVIMKQRITTNSETHKYVNETGVNVSVFISVLCYPELFYFLKGGIWNIKQIQEADE